VPEIRRLIHRSSDRAEQRRERLRWSDWRRAHQAGAQRCHRQRRARVNPEPLPRTVSATILAGTAALTDERWARVAPLIAPQKPARGRPATNHRLVLEGILWVARTGLAWRSLPERFGPWETVHSRYRRWRLAGLWDRIVLGLHASDTNAPS
jgi:Putative transposase of IS4/5 family (DUF4096)